MYVFTFMFFLIEFSCLHCVVYFYFIWFLACLNYFVLLFWLLMSHFGWRGEGEYYERLISPRWLLFN